MSYSAPSQAPRSYYAMSLSSSQSYPSSSQLLPSTHSAPDPATFDFPTGTVKFDCPWCDKCYVGPNGRSVWRRHAQEKHNLPCNARRSRPLTARTHSLPSHPSESLKISEGGQREQYGTMKIKQRDVLVHLQNSAPQKGETPVMHRPKKRRSLNDDKENEDTPTRILKKIRRDSLPIFVQPDSATLSVVSSTHPWPSTVYDSPYKPHAPLALNQNDPLPHADLKTIPSYASLHSTAADEDATRASNAVSAVTWTAEEQEMLSFIVDKVDHSEDSPEASKQTADGLSNRETDGLANGETTSHSIQGFGTISQDDASSSALLPFPTRSNSGPEKRSDPIRPSVSKSHVVLVECSTSVGAGAQGRSGSESTPQKDVAEGGRPTTLSPLRVHPITLFSPSSVYASEAQHPASPHVGVPSFSCISPFRSKLATTTPDKRRLALELGLVAESSPRGGFYRAQVRSTVAGQWVDDF